MRISDWSSDVCSSDLARAQIWRPARSAGAASLSDADQFLRVEPSEARSDGRRRAGKAARRRLVDSQQEDGRGLQDKSRLSSPVRKIVGWDRDIVALHTDTGVVRARPLAFSASPGVARRNAFAPAPHTGQA